MLSYFYSALLTAHSNIWKLEKKAFVSFIIVFLVRHIKFSRGMILCVCARGRAAAQLRENIELQSNERQLTCERSQCTINVARNTSSAALGCLPHDLKKSRTVSLLFIFIKNKGEGVCDQLYQRLAFVVSRV